MHCMRDPDLPTFVTHTASWLHADPVTHHPLLLVSDVRYRGLVPVEPDARWFRILDARGALVAAAGHTPPSPLVVTAASGEPAEAGDTLASETAETAEAAETLADTLYGATTAPDRLLAPCELARQFAARWSAHGGTAEPAFHMRLHRLDRVTPPAGVPGALRPATPADRDLLVAWLAAFRAEATPHETGTDPARAVDRGLARGNAAWLWDDGGTPVAMLATPPFAAGVARLNAVYTPPERRGCGYASAAVAAASQGALDQGATACALFTDLANPTSNRIYRAVGYEPVYDAVEYRLRR